MLNTLNLPAASAKRIALHVKPAAERALRAGHPWVFDQAIRKQSRDGAAGDLAVIFDERQRFLAVGLYDPHSPIRVRVLQHGEPATIDRAWLAARLRRAAAAREPLHGTQTDGYRLVHGENDGLPGLVVDRYDRMLVLKLYTSAWLPYLPDIAGELAAVQPHDALVLRASRQLDALLAPYGLHDGVALAGRAPASPVVFRENGLRFAADVVHGHKTGFFFDHRDNRLRVRNLAAGRQVLDVFAYSGGFSVNAAAGGATVVTSVDVSAQALEAAAANLALNRDNGEAGARVRRAAHRTIAADAFACLEQMLADRRRFDLVVADPPSFAKSAAETERALATYARLTRLALGVLAPGGTLVIASCSSRVGADAFFAAVHTAARQGGAPLRELERSAHALDHPVGFPEGAYLKCLFAARLV